MAHLWVMLAADEPVTFDRVVVANDTHWERPWKRHTAHDAISCVSINTLYAGKPFAPSPYPTPSGNFACSLRVPTRSMGSKDLHWVSSLRSVESRGMRFRALNKFA